jgi:hypothetical protein
MGRAASLTMLCLAAILCRASGATEPVTAVSMAHPAISCGSLGRFAPPDLVVETLESVRSETVKLAPAGAIELPAHCLFRATLARRISADGQRFGIGMELRLPLAWNGEFVFQGGGGLDGVLAPSYGTAAGADPPALARGFAVVSTDGGHRSGSMIDAHFALDQQARIDYAYNAVDKTTFLAKMLIARFYGREPRHSYFVGCSNGGRQAMMATQRMPMQFDGVVAGDPSFRLTRVNLDQAWNEIVLARAAPKDAQGRPILSKALSEADLKLVANAVLKECDARDGLVDGMINDYRNCHFEPAVLTCKAAKKADCLSLEQVAALKALMAGPQNSHGESLYSSFPYDSGIADSAFYRMHFGNSATGEPNSADATLGFDSLRYYSLTPPDPAFDPMKFDFDRDPARLKETAKVNDADSVFLESFSRHGKLILYHGLSDQGISPLDTVAWYQRVQSQSRMPIRQWARLYVVPGMTHCAGGPSTDQFDMLSAIDGWVDRQQAPDRVIARGKSFPGLTRPLCPYPQMARYAGGDPKDEKSFVCKE